MPFETVLPEATIAEIEREIPGLPELMRLVGLQKTRKAALWRPVVGVRKNTLIVNLPGDPDGAKTALEAVFSLLEGVVETVTASSAISSSDSPGP